VGALAGVAQLERGVAEDVLYALSSLSLVFETDDGRYWQHPLLAEFACEHLSDERPAYRRMAEYYLDYAVRHHSDYDRLERASAHFAAGLRVVYQQALWPMVLGYADALGEAWFARGRFAELRQNYAWACEAATALGDQAALAGSLLRWGQACLEQSEYAEAQQHLTDSLDTF